TPPLATPPRWGRDNGWWACHSRGHDVTVADNICTGTGRGCWGGLTIQDRLRWTAVRVVFRRNPSFSNASHRGRIRFNYHARLVYLAVRTACCSCRSNSGQEDSSESWIWRYHIEWTTARHGGLEPGCGGW